MRRILAQSHLDVTCQRKERLPKRGKKENKITWAKILAESRLDVACQAQKKTPVQTKKKKK